MFPSVPSAVPMPTLFLHFTGETKVKGVEKHFFSFENLSRKRIRDHLKEPCGQVQFEETKSAELFLQ